MIGSVNTGGGGNKEPFAYIEAIYLEGETCICVHGSDVLKAKDKSGTWLFALPYSGTWTVSTDDTHSKEVTVTEKDEIRTVHIIVPNAYQQVSYIESVGETSYKKGAVLDTGFVLSGEQKLEIEFTPLAYTKPSGGTNEVTICGGMDSQIYAHRRSVYCQKQNEKPHLIMGIGGANVVWTGRDITLGETYYLIQDKTATYLNGELLIEYEVQDFTMGASLLLFGEQTDIKYYCFGTKRISYFALSLNGNYLARYIPCYLKSASTKTGLFYDLVTNTAKASTGSKAFTIIGEDLE